MKPFALLCLVATIQLCVVWRMAVRTGGTGEDSAEANIMKCRAQGPCKKKPDSQNRNRLKGSGKCFASAARVPLTALAAIGILHVSLERTNFMSVF